MCIFITLIAKRSDKDLISNILINAGRRAEVIDNPSLRKSIGEDDIQLVTTNGHCDCGTVLGDEPQNVSDKFAPDIKKLKRKKWSQAKIDRYIEDQKKKVKKLEASGSDSLELWADIISMALTSGAQHVGLFYRMYSGLMETETFEPTTRNVNFKVFENTEFRQLRENEVCYFR